MGRLKLPNTIEVTLKKSHFRNGLSNNCQECVIALAITDKLQRLLNEDFERLVEVGCRDVDVYNPDADADGWSAVNNWWYGRYLPADPDLHVSIVAKFDNMGAIAAEQRYLNTTLTYVLAGFYDTDRNKTEGPSRDENA